MASLNYELCLHISIILKTLVNQLIFVLPAGLEGEELGKELLSKTKDAEREGEGDHCSSAVVVSLGLVLLNFKVH